MNLKRLTAISLVTIPFMAFADLSDHGRVLHDTDSGASTSGQIMIGILVIVAIVIIISFIVNNKDGVASFLRKLFNLVCICCMIFGLFLVFFGRCDHDKSNTNQHSEAPLSYQSSNSNSQSNTIDDASVTKKSINTNHKTEIICMFCRGKGTKRINIQSTWYDMKCPYCHGSGKQTVPIPKIYPK